MHDPLTVDEVAALARRALGELYLVPTSSRTAPEIRRRVDNAAGYLNELLWLVDLVVAVDAGAAIVVDEVPR